MRLAIAAVALVGLGGPLAAPALAGPPDTTPPTLVMQPARYVVGSQVSAMVETDGSDEYYYYGWTARWDWKASDASKICSQSMIFDNGDPYVDEFFFRKVPTGKRTFTGAIGTYQSYKGNGPGSVTVRVKDCAGNTTTVTTPAYFPRSGEDTDPAIAYARSWGTAHFPGFLAGRTHYTIEKGASATLSVDGGAVALVMEKAADRGSAAVFVDGRQVAVVNTNSAKTLHRAVVWQTVLSPGIHTLKIVNLATPGRPRIDLDAVLS